MCVTSGDQTVNFTKHELLGVTYISSSDTNDIKHPDEESW